MRSVVSCGASGVDGSVLVVWYWDVLVVVAAVVGGEEELGRLSAQARAQGLVAAQHRRQVLGLLRQLLHLLPQGGVLLLQVLALLEDGTRERGLVRGRGGSWVEFRRCFWTMVRTVERNNCASRCGAVRQPPSAIPVFSAISFLLTFVVFSGFSQVFQVSESSLTTAGCVP